MSIQEAFDKFDQENAGVWRLFIRFTFDMIEAGRAHYSANSIVGRIRWHSDVQTNGKDFKINSNFPSRYARKFHRTFPKYDGFFRSRILRG